MLFKRDQIFIWPLDTILGLMMDKLWEATNISCLLVVNLKKKEFKSNFFLLELWFKKSKCWEKNAALS